MCVFLRNPPVAQLVFESAMLCVREKLPEMDLEADRLPKEIMGSLSVTQEHVNRALALTNPSTLRESAIEMPNVKWEDIGGLEDVKRELKETVQYPVQVKPTLRQAACPLRLLVSLTSSHTSPCAP